MIVANFLSILLFLLTSWAHLTLQKNGISSSCYTTPGKSFDKGFEGKILSQNTIWSLMKKFHANNQIETSIVYQVSDLVNNFFNRKIFPNESIVEGIVVLSGNLSSFGVWEYNDSELNGLDEIGTTDDKAWKQIPVHDGNLLNNLGVPHWHAGAIDIESSCQHISDRIFMHSKSINCQPIVHIHESSVFISHTNYIRFRRRRNFWNHFQSVETKMVFQPVYTRSEKILPYSKGNLCGISSDIAILRAELTDCSGKPIFSQPKWVDECGICGGDNSSCKTCDKGKVLYRGNCIQIEELMSSGHNSYKMGFPSGDLSNPKDGSNVSGNKTGIYLKNKSIVNTFRPNSLSDSENKSYYLTNFIELQPKTPPYSKEIKSTKIKKWTIEIKGPDSVYADDETFMQVQPISHQIINTQFALKWKLFANKPHKSKTIIKGVLMKQTIVELNGTIYNGIEEQFAVWSALNFPHDFHHVNLTKLYWHINGTFNQGKDGIQRGTKLIIVKHALQPFNEYQVTAFMEIENAPGIVHTATKILKVNSKGILAILNATLAAANQKRFLHLDASSSLSIENSSNKLLQFAWKCHSVTDTANSLCDGNRDRCNNDDLPWTKEYVDESSLMKRVLKIDTNCLKPGRYIWSVTVFNSYSSATASQTIDVHSGSPSNSSSTKKLDKGSDISFVSENKAINNDTHPLLKMSNECTLERLKALLIRLVVKPAATIEKSMGTVFSFRVLFNMDWKTDIDHAFFQKLTYNIGYMLNSNSNETASDNNSFWLQTSSALVSTTWDYLPSGENVTPVVKVCASSYQCTSASFPSVKVASLSQYSENSIRKIFENKIYNMEINGAITFLYTTLISLKNLGKEILESKLSPIFSDIIERYSLIIAESEKISYSRDFQNSISSLRDREMDSIAEGLVRQITSIQTTIIGAGSLINLPILPNIQNISKNSIRVKRKSPRIASHENDFLETLKENNETKATLLEDVTNRVLNMCTALGNSNSSEAEVAINNTRIKVVYIKDRHIHSSTEFGWPRGYVGFEKDTYNSIDFGYFLKTRWMECGNRTKKVCDSVCLTAVHFDEVFLKPSEKDFDSAMWQIMVYQMNITDGENSNKKTKHFGPAVLEFNINEIVENHKAECRVWDDERNDWSNVCNSAIVYKHKDRILQCFCKKIGYLKVLEMEIELPLKRKASLEQEPVEFRHQLYVDGLERTTFAFTLKSRSSSSFCPPECGRVGIIEPVYDMSAGRLRAIFELYIAKQLSSILNISEVLIERWDLNPGGVVVTAILINPITSSHQRDHSDGKSLKAAVQLLDNKITTGTLLLLDLEDRPLNISQSSVTRRMAEEMNVVVGIIIGSVLVVGMMTFTFSSIRKYRKEKLDSVRPIKNYDGVQDVDKFDSTYNGSHVSSEELGTDVNYDGISCIDTSEITIRRVTSMSESQSSNSKRSTLYINTNMADINHLPNDVTSSVSVTHSSGEYGISTFPNMITS